MASGYNNGLTGVIEHSLLKIIVSTESYQLRLDFNCEVLARAFGSSTPNSRDSLINA